jgi:Carboxypeptidase regulatory-like domain
MASTVPQAIRAPAALPVNGWFAGQGYGLQPVPFEPGPIPINGERKTQGTAEAVPFQDREGRVKMPRWSDIPRLLMVATSVLAMTASARAQIEVPSPYHLAHLRGVFVDAKGNAIPDAAVTLDRNDKTLYSIKTDRTGKFEIKHISGRYRLHINMKGYSTVDREVVVGVEAVTYLHGTTLYVIAGPGACSDDCSSVFTSKGKFDQAIRRNTRQNY